MCRGLKGWCTLASTRVQVYPAVTSSALQHPLVNEAEPKPVIRTLSKHEALTPNAGTMLVHRLRRCA